MISTSGCGPAPPLHGHVKFEPSRRKTFSSTPAPKADTQLLFRLEAFPPEGEVGDIPGASLIQSKRLNRRTGIALISSEPKRIDNPVFRVSIVDTDAATSMDSVIVATRRVTSRGVFASTPTRTP